LEAERGLAEKSDIAKRETFGEVVEIAQSFPEEQLAKNAKVSPPESLATSPIDTVLQSSLPKEQGAGESVVTDPIVPEEAIHPAFRKREILANNEPNTK